MEFPESSKIGFSFTSLLTASVVNNTLFSHENPSNRNKKKKVELTCILSILDCTSIQEYSEKAKTILNTLQSIQAIYEFTKTTFTCTLPCKNTHTGKGLFYHQSNVLIAHK